MHALVPTRPWIAATVLALAACNGPADDTADTADTGPMDTQAQGYLVHSAVQSTDDRLNYFTIVDSPSADRELAYDQSLELPGRARLYAAEGIGYFAIGDSEGMSITRYDVVEGELVQGQSLSLQAHGVTSLGAQAVYFAGPDKAYYKDATQAQVIVWDPSEMVIEEVLELPDSVIESGHIPGTSDWATRDGEAYFTLHWYTPQYDQVLEGATLVRIDTETDELTVTSDDRCRGMATARNVDDTLYFFSGVINGFGHHVYPDEGGDPNCILRIEPGAEDFDDDWVGTLSDAVPEGTTGVAMDVTSEGTIWAQVVDLSTAPSAEGTTYAEWYGADWRWYTIPLDGLDTATQQSSTAGAYTGFTLSTGDGFFVSETAADYSETVLIDLSGEQPDEGLSFPGFVLDVSPVQ